MKLCISFRLLVVLFKGHDLCHPPRRLVTGRSVPEICEIGGQGGLVVGSGEASNARLLIEKLKDPKLGPIRPSKWA
jgi:hypothetical protein